MRTEITRSCSGHEFRGPAAFQAVALHVVHRAVELFGKPGLETTFGYGEIDTSLIAGLLKAKFIAPGDDLRLEGRHLGIAVWGRGYRQCQIRAA